ncbi:MAG: ABC transporter ATP-binding protein [Pseudolabrys sp.]|nr:ABC transporter ATP-binding protein [Pseudolabrys sp.]MDP2298562.1 ABC transporter ATP-binding protein [Pseudolabrys sp.]
MTAIATIEAKGIHAYYDTSHVLHGIDLTVGRGEIVSLMGRNGMGKTTTLRALLGLIQPRQGTVLVHGRDMTGAPTHRVALAGIAMVPEGGGIFPKLTVYENLVMAARPGREGKTSWTCEHILELFPRLSERLRSMGANLSGGERQMLAIGRALMTNPDLLVLDEATEGLAPLIRQEIWAIIRRLRSSGVAVLVVDKDIEALATIADRCVIIAKGRIVYEGTPAALAADREVLMRHLSV